MELQSALCTLAVPKPADPSRKPLKLNLFLRHRQPSREMIVVGEKVHDCVIGFVDIFLLTRQSYPAKRPFSFTEQRPDIGRNKAGIVKGVRNTIVVSPLS